MANVKLEEIVAAYTNGNFLGKAEYSRLYLMGIAGIKALNMDVTGQSKTYSIPLDRNLTGRLPADFLNDVRVHVPGDEGAGLLKDNTLDLYEEDEEDCCDGNYNDLGYSNESTINTNGINWIGKYKIDRDRGRIVVNPEFCYSCVELVYLASPKANASGEWFVDELAAAAVEAFIRWKDHLGKKSIGLYEKETHRRNWLKEKKNAKIRMVNITRGQMNQNARSGNKYKVKN